MNFNELVSLCESKVKIIRTFHDRKKKLPRYIIYTDEYGIKNRLDGPAEILYSRIGKIRESWYIKGIKSSDTRPSEIVYDDKTGNINGEYWYRNDVYHRLTGPAIIYYNRDGTSSIERYFIRGKEYTKEEFKEYTKDLNKDQLDMLSDLGQSFD